MADAKTRKDEQQPAPPADAKPPRKSLGIRLAPADNSDQPVVANCTQLNVAPGMVFIDFGFLEPAMMNALPRVAKAGGKLPESIRGRLAVRVAVGYDTLAGLHQQLGRMLAGLDASRRK
jgi:hypothetical protein